MVSRWMLLTFFQVLGFDRVLAASDPEATIARLLAENALLQRQLKAAESKLSHNSTVSLPNSSVLPSRKRFLHAEEGGQASSETIIEEAADSHHTEAGSEHEHAAESEHAAEGPLDEEGHPIHGPLSVFGPEGHHESAAEAHHTSGEEEEVCYGEHAKECTPTEKAEEIQKMMPAFLLAVMVMGNIVAMSALVLLTKWKDADVRKSVYQMISTFLSIFCAIFINKLMCDFIIYQILPCSPPFLVYKGGFGIVNPHHGRTPEHNCGEAPHHFAILVFLLLFFVYHVGCTYIMFQARPTSEDSWFGGSKRIFHVAGNLGGHLRGFAGVATFGIMQQVYLDHNLWQVLGCVAGAWIFFTAVRGISHLIRQERVLADSKKKKVAPNDVGDGEHQPFLAKREEQVIETTEKIDSMCCGDGGKSPPWSKAVMESEDESTAVCIGFLNMQVVCFLCFGYVPPVEEEDNMVFDKTKRHRMQLFEGVFGGLIILVIVLRQFMPKEWKNEDRILYRFIKSFQRCAAMSFCWTLFKHGNWFWRELVNDIFNPSVEGGRLHEHPPESIIIMAIIFNACWLTTVSLVALVFLDGAADVEECVKKEDDCNVLCKCDTWSEACLKLCSSLDPGFFGVLFRKCGFQCGEYFGRNRKLKTVYEIISEGQAHVNKGSGNSNVRTSWNENTKHELPTPGDALEDDEEDEEEEGIFRELIESLGFLIGICWEKAFSEANGVFTSSFLDLAELLDKDKFSEVHVAIGPMIYHSMKHPLVFKYMVGGFMLAVVLVTWVKYLVPYARIGKAQHIYLQAAEEFGCNHMTKHHIPDVANNTLRQYATTLEFKEKLRCLECEKETKIKPTVLTFDQSSTAGKGDLICKRCNKKNNILKLDD